MRIALSCLQSRRAYAIPAYHFWETYFKCGIAEAQHVWLEVPNADWAAGLAPMETSALRSWSEEIWSRTVLFLKQEHARCRIDMFLTYLYPQQVDSGAIKDLQGAGIRCVNFFCDNLREFRSIPSEFGCFDLNWVPEREAVTMYEAARFPYIHAAMPCWVPPELRNIPERETEPPTFIGSADALRRDLIGRAIRAGADIYVQGAGWSDGADQQTETSLRGRSLGQLIVNQLTYLRVQGLEGMVYKFHDRIWPLNGPAVPQFRAHPPVSDLDYTRITREAVITIGVNRVPTAKRSLHRPLSYSRLRDIEAPMLGACYLAEWTRGLDDLYELGTEIETYRTPEELASKVDELKKDEARRRKLRERGQKRALADHTVSATLRRIAQRLFE